VHPEQIRGFADLASHPWVVQVATEVLGPDYEIVELGFDIPFAGAMDQPWHRDFPIPDTTRTERRLTSLAINVTTVEDMGPFEIAPGTQWDDSPEFDHEMFPPRSHYGRYLERAMRKYPRRGDVSIRSALTIHRGTANQSQLARPVLVFGLDVPGAGNTAHHDMAVGQSSQEYFRSLPRGAAVGPLGAKVLCRHVSKSGHVRHYPVAEVRGGVIICNGNHLPLSSATGGPPLDCPGCPGRERYLDPEAIRRRISMQHTSVLVLDADDVSTEVAALDPES